MGYYSDVNVAMRVKDYRALLAKVKENAEKIEGLDWLMKQAEVVSLYPKRGVEGQYVALFWCNMEWHEYATGVSPAYPNVKFIMNFIRWLDEVSFVRVGEGEMDIERIDNGAELFDVFCVKHHIEISD